MKDVLIELKEVTFSFGKQKILNNINLELHRGISYALIGKSGVGKSTLLNLVAGFIRPLEGKILIDGMELTKPRPNSAFLFQELGLFPWQTVYEAVQMAARLKQQSINVKEKVMALLQEMKLDHLKDKYPHNLSGGERQRVALARTLIGKPDFLLMDEPTSSLDTMTKEQIEQLILQEQLKRRNTLLFVTHDMEEAVLLGQEILILESGGTVQRLDNPFYGVENAKEQLGFYDKCIQLRKLLKMEEEHV